MPMNIRAVNDVSYINITNKGIVTVHQPISEAVNKVSNYRLTTLNIIKYTSRAISVKFRKTN